MPITTTKSADDVDLGETTIRRDDSGGPFTVQSAFEGVDSEGESFRKLIETKLGSFVTRDVITAAERDALLAIIRKIRLRQRTDARLDP